MNKDTKSAVWKYALVLFILIVINAATIIHARSTADSADLVEERLTESVNRVLEENQQLRTANQLLVEKLRLHNIDVELPAISSVSLEEITELLAELQDNKGELPAIALWLPLMGQTILAIAGLALLRGYSKKCSTIEFLEDELADLEAAKRRDERRIKELLQFIREQTAHINNLEQEIKKLKSTRQ